MKFTIITALAGAAFVWAAGPPVREPVEVTKGIAQLADDDAAVRRVAMTRLEALGERALPALRRVTADARLDADVRLRAAVVARAIRQREWAVFDSFDARTHISPFSGPPFLTRVRLSPDGKYAVGACGPVILYDLKTGTELARGPETFGTRVGLAVAPDSKHVLTAQADERDFHLLELPSLRVARTFTGHTDKLRDIALAPNGRLAASIAADRTARLWDVQTGRELRRAAGYDHLSSAVAFTPDGKRLLVASHATPREGPALWVFDVATGRRLSRWPVPVDTVVGLTAHPDGETVVICSWSGHVVLLRLDDGHEVLRLDHGKVIFDHAVTPDGRFVLTAGAEDTRVKVWHLGTGRPWESLDEHEPTVACMDVAADGRRALTCDGAGRLRLWKLGR